tara:strand:+ start:531 stop:797 length:267 start_codon:yes stop_codon:yes gene_type:complete
MCSGIKHYSLLSSSGLTATNPNLTLYQTQHQSLLFAGLANRSVIEAEYLSDKVIEGYSQSAPVIEAFFVCDKVIETESERSEVIEVKS